MKAVVLPGVEALVGDNRCRNELSEKAQLLTDVHVRSSVPRRFCLSVLRSDLTCCLGTECQKCNGNDVVD